VKYWNKSKRVRERCWIKVQRPQYQNLHVPVHLLKQWGWNQHSTGKFFVGNYDGYVWFEHSEDATWFLLRWS
jgi:hypothetical protein